MAAHVPLFRQALAARGRREMRLERPAILPLSFANGRARLNKALCQVERDKRGMLPRPPCEVTMPRVNAILSRR